MRLLLDEHFSSAIAEQLRQLGHDVVAVQKERPDLEGHEDDHVLRAAAAEMRVVVTNNVRDFAVLVEDFGLAGETHYGVIFTDDATFPRTETGIGSLVRSLAAFIDGTPDDSLLDSCLYLSRG